MCARGPTPAECGTALRNVFGFRMSFSINYLCVPLSGTALLATTMDRATQHRFRSRRRAEADPADSRYLYVGTWGAGGVGLQPQHHDDELSLKIKCSGWTEARELPDTLRSRMYFVRADGRNM